MDAVPRPTVATFTPLPPPVFQEGRVVGEEELLDSLQISLPRPLEEVLTALRKVCKRTGDLGFCLGAMPCTLGDEAPCSGAQG